MFHTLYATKLVERERKVEQRVELNVARMQTIAHDLSKLIDSVAHLHSHDDIALMRDAANTLSDDTNSLEAFATQIASLASGLHLKLDQRDDELTRAAELVAHVRETATV
jgi:uncharacterized protein YoxC